MRASRSAVAAIRLSDMNLADVAAPNRRCVLEHAIALKWLAKEGNPLAHTIKNGHRYSVEKIDKALQQADWKSVDRSAVAEILAESEPTKDQKAADRFLNFMPRVVEYGEPTDVPPYLAETGRSHPSWESAAGYIDPDTLEFLDTEGDRLSTVQACFVYLAVSLDAFHQLLEGDPWYAFFNELNAYLETRYPKPRG